MSPCVYAQRVNNRWILELVPFSATVHRHCKYQTVISHQNCNNYKYLQELISFALLAAPSFLNRTIREEKWIMFMDNEFIYAHTS